MLSEICFLCASVLYVLLSFQVLQGYIPINRNDFFCYRGVWSTGCQLVKSKDIPKRPVQFGLYRAFNTKCDPIITMGNPSIKEKGW